MFKGIKDAPKRLESIYSLDLRSLALLRIGVALVLLVDLTIRSTDLEAHYSDSGILPLEALFTYGWNDFHFSLYTMASSWPLQALFFLINGICIFFLLVGYRTRLFTFICWLFLLSLHNRNPLVHQAGDDLLRLVMFWGLFLPWGYYYAIDAAPAERINKPTQYHSIAGIGYMLQIFSVYFFSAMLKTSPEWTSEFTALYYALSLDAIQFPFGKFLYGYENLLTFLTAATYYTELLLPFLLFIPFYNQTLRLIFVGVISSLHIGIAMSMNVGLFPLIGIVAMLGLTPSFLAKKLDAKMINLGKKGRKLLRRIFAPPGKLHFPTENKLKAVCAAFFILYMLAWNIRTTGVKIPDAGLNWVGHFFRVDQYWAMFAPAVFKDDGWFILIGTSDDGKEYDLLQAGATPDFEKPLYIAGTYKNDRWRKYAENILFIYNSHYRLYYCNYMRDQWNKKHTPRIEELEVVYMKIKSLPDYKEADPSRESLCRCGRLKKRK